MVMGMGMDMGVKGQGPCTGMGQWREHCMGPDVSTPAVATPDRATSKSIDSSPLSAARSAPLTSRQNSSSTYSAELLRFNIGYRWITDESHRCSFTFDSATWKSHGRLGRHVSRFSLPRLLK